MNKIYFSRINVVGEPIAKSPTLFIASHRNGAVDGLVYSAALSDTPSLVSIQLLRNKFLRLLFDGIPVVRAKDCKRYGFSLSDVASPIDAGVAQIQQGGNLCLMPEGTSEWQASPLKYQRGMAKIVQKLQQENINFSVQPIGVFYTRPDGFRNSVSIVAGKAFIPKDNDLNAIQNTLTQALDEVSVNCQSNAHFNAVQSQAWQAYLLGEDFGQAFLQKQSQAQIEQVDIIKSKKSSWAKMLCYAGFPTITLLAQLATLGSDGLNNRSFFKIMGGLVGAIFHLILLSYFIFSASLLATIWTIIGFIGWYFYPEPTPLDLEITEKINE